MKRFTLAVIILVLVAVSCVAGLFYINIKKNKYSNLLATAYDVAKDGNTEKAKELVEEFRSDWDSHEKWLMLVIHRKDLDEINFTSTQANEYIKSEELPEYYAEIKKILALLDHTWETEVPVLSNIL